MTFSQFRMKNKIKHIYGLFPYQNEFIIGSFTVKDSNLIDQTKHYLACDLQNKYSNLKGEEHLDEWKIKINRINFTAINSGEYSLESLCLWMDADKYDAHDFIHECRNLFMEYFIKLGTDVTSCDKSDIAYRLMPFRSIMDNYLKRLTTSEIWNGEIVTVVDLYRIVFKEIERETIEPYL